MLCLDIGHYGCDSGATYGVLREDELNYKIAQRVKDKVRGVDINFTTGTLQGRVSYANNKGSDFFLSIHCNSTYGATGVETLVYSDNGLSKLVQANCVKETGLRDRGIKVGKDLYVLKNTKMKACLVECGFIQEDWKNIDLRVEQFSTAIANAIMTYYKVNTSKCPTCGK